MTVQTPSPAPVAAHAGSRQVFQVALLGALVGAVVALAGGLTVAKMAGLFARAPSRRRSPPARSRSPLRRWIHSRSRVALSCGER
ncbi:MAG: hypothetical protein JWQ95_5289 [Sphaerisporangium sp.]|nr:hypothetical protein [Sphaerisporangium sp.]